MDLLPTVLFRGAAQGCAWGRGGAGDIRSLEGWLLRLPPNASSVTSSPMCHAHAISRQADRHAPGGHETPVQK